MDKRDPRLTELLKSRSAADDQGKLDEFWRELIEGGSVVAAAQRNGLSDPGVGTGACALSPRSMSVVTCSGGRRAGRNHRLVHACGYRGVAGNLVQIEAFFFDRLDICHMGANIGRCRASWRHSDGLGAVDQ